MNDIEEMTTAEIALRVWKTERTVQRWIHAKCALALGGYVVNGYRNHLEGIILGLALRSEPRCRKVDKSGTVWLDLA